MDRTTYTVEDQERMTRAENYFAWQSRLIQKYLGRRVIEVGCGMGNFTRLLLDRELIVAVDVEPRCIERLEEAYSGRANLRAFVCDAASREFRDLARFRPDTCVCLNVLEHVPDDEAALYSMACVLPPGGSVVLLIPAFQSLYGPIDRNLGHYRRYSRAAIHRLARSAGLCVKQTHYFNAIGFFGWWTNSHLLRREAQSEQQIEFFDRYVVPFASAVERLAHPPFGQSLLAVLEKE
jgi:2-polyprenyl-3-methyl-5-hydroxy-6-metoxy-1,4-benzoquinol methylase